MQRAPGRGEAGSSSGGRSAHHVRNISWQFAAAGYALDTIKEVKSLGLEQQPNGVKEVPLAGAKRDMESAAAAATARPGLISRFSPRRLFSGRRTLWHEQSKKMASFKSSGTSQSLDVESAVAARQRRASKASPGVNLIQVAIRSKHADCVRVVVDALLAGRFSKASVMLHLYDGLQELIHDSRNKRVCRRLLKRLQLLDNGEVVVTSGLVRRAQLVYRCGQHGDSSDVWTEGNQWVSLLAALDILILKASWSDSIAAFLFRPIVMLMRLGGQAWLWALSRLAVSTSGRAEVSAVARLVPLACAAEIRGDKSLLRQLSVSNAEPDMYGSAVVRAVIHTKWHSFAKGFLLLQYSQYMTYVILYVVYINFAVYHADSSWDTYAMVRSPAGQGALVLELLLMIMTAGIFADEIRQMVEYKASYWLSPWNYMDLSSCLNMTIITLLHLTQASNPLFVVLVALHVLLLSFRMLYFCMAYEHFGAMVRMVMIVIRDMRYFFVLLTFILCSFGLTLSLMLKSSEGQNSNADAFASGFDTAILQLFTIIFGDFQYSNLQGILSLGTAVSKLAVALLCCYAVLLLIVLVNLLIAIVSETYDTVRTTEENQILRNKALIIDEIESTLPPACVQELNARILLPFVHVLVPQQVWNKGRKDGAKDMTERLSKLKHVMLHDVPERQRKELQALTATVRDLAAKAGSPTQPGVPAQQQLQQLQQQQLQISSLHEKLDLLSAQMQQMQQMFLNAFAQERIPSKQQEAA